MNGLAIWALGYLFNSLWEVPAIFAAGWLAAWLVRRIGPQPRLEHRVWVGAMALAVILPACSLDLRRVELLLQWVKRLFSAPGSVGASKVAVVMGGGSVYGHSVLRLPATVLMGIVAAYAGSLLYFAGRLGWGLWQIHAIQRQAERITLEGEAAMCVVRYREFLGLGEISVASSNLLAGPVTVGIFRRILLVPPGFLDNVEAGDLEALVAHEFAHMQRRDFLKNVVYGVLTLPVAFHPVLWLTRAGVAETREMVCDAMAAAAVTGGERYARSLLRLAAMLANRAGFANGMQARPLHAIGIFDANKLGFERRIMSLTARRVEIKGMRRIAGAAACVVIGVATCGSALALRMEVGTPVAASEANGPATGHNPAKVAGGVMAGNILTKVNPVYPQDAKDAKISGAVVMKAVIDKEGKIANLQVVSGPKELQRASIDAVRQWTYKPYLLNGQPTEVETMIQVTYSFDR